jgi:predicted metal-dependent phosphotriesterase family hydrolase
VTAFLATVSATVPTAFAPFLRQPGFTEADIQALANANPEKRDWILEAFRLCAQPK